MRRLCICFALFLLLTGTAWTANEDDNNKTGPSGLPLPRFASLRSDEVNMRTGPGTRYPIEWVFRRVGLPVEITAEYDVWRRIRDWEGSEGWVHKSNLSGKRTAIITGQTRDLYKDDVDSSPLVARIEPNNIGYIDSCDELWCKIKIEGVKGYMKKNDFWGTYAHEKVR